MTNKKKVLNAITVVFSALAIVVTVINYLFVYCGFYLSGMIKYIAPAILLILGILVGKRKTIYIVASLAIPVLYNVAIIFDGGFYGIDGIVSKIASIVIPTAIALIITFRGKKLMAVEIGLILLWIIFTVLFGNKILTVGSLSIAQILFIKANDFCPLFTLKVSSYQTTEQMLLSLKDQFDRGVITESYYKEKRSEIISKLK